MLALSQLEATEVATEMSYYAAKRPQNDVHKLKLRNVVLCLHLATWKLQGLQQKCRIMFAFSKLKAARVATEMSYYASKRPQNDVHKLNIRNVVLCLRLASWKLQGLQQKCPIMLQSDLRTMSTNWSSKTGSRRKSRQIGILKRFLINSWIGKSSISNSEKLGEKTLLHNLIKISFYACV